MKTPKHLAGFVSVLVAVEEAIKGTDYEWLVRSDGAGYLSNIYKTNGINFPHHATTPAGALSRSLMEFNLRSGK